MYYVKYEIEVTHNINILHGTLQVMKLIKGNLNFALSHINVSFKIFPPGSTCHWWELNNSLLLLLLLFVYKETRTKIIGERGDYLMLLELELIGSLISVNNESKIKFFAVDKNLMH